MVLPLPLLTTETSSFFSIEVLAEIVDCAAGVSQGHVKTYMQLPIYHGAQSG